MPPSLPLTGPGSWGAPRATHTHNGIDLGGAEGRPVYSAGAGVVTHAVQSYQAGFSGYGRTVTIAHGDGSHTLYGHLQSVLVVPGQPVAPGQLIGTLGRTAFTAADPAALTDGPHVHFEASASSYPQASSAPRLDPVAWLQTAGRVHPLAGVSLPPNSPLQEFSASPLQPPIYVSTYPTARPPAWFWHAAGLAIGLGLVLSIGPKLPRRLSA